MIECLIVENPIDPTALTESVRSNADGAVALFLGTVRETSGAADRPGAVDRLEYEAYAPMAEKELVTIAEEAVGLFGVSSLVVHHRVGLLALGEIAVCIAVGSRHRAGAFDASRFVIEELKKRVPIWKKEVFEDGAVWVDPRP